MQISVKREINAELFCPHTNQPGQRDSWRDALLLAWREFKNDGELEMHLLSSKPLDWLTRCEASSLSAEKIRYYFSCLFCPGHARPDMPYDLLGFVWLREMRNNIIKPRNLYVWHHQYLGPVWPDFVISREATQSENWRVKFEKWGKNVPAWAGVNTTTSPALSLI